MENEKELLKKDLEGIDSGDKAALEQFKSDIEGTGYEELEQLAQQKINAIGEQVQQMEDTTALAMEQVQSMGGNPIELEEKINTTQENIINIQQQVEKDVSGLEEAFENKEPKQINNENIDEYIDKIRSGEIDITKFTNEGFVSGGKTIKKIFEDPQISLLKKLNLNGNKYSVLLEDPESRELLINSSSKNDIIEAAKQGLLLPQYVPDNLKEEVFDSLYLLNLKIDFDKEIDRIISSEKASEQLDTTALGRMVSAYGVIDSLYADTLVQQLKQKFEGNPYRENIIKQLEGILNYYRKDGKVERFKKFE